MSSRGRTPAASVMGETGSVSVPHTKLEALRSLLRDLAPVLVAFSGGVDSTVLLKAAALELGSEAVLAVTAHGDVHTEEELAAARDAASRFGVRHLVVTTNELAVPGLAANPPERCYLCRHALYERLIETGREHGMKTVLDGGNSDDMDDYRPGLKAARELGVRSPLAEVGLNKAEVRALGRDWGLPEWDRPSSPCLASRFPYRESITPAGLAMVAEAERYLRGLGIKTVRVRHHKDLARIEVSESDMGRLMGLSADPSGVGGSVRHDIVDYLRELGYTYVALDMRGFRSGSLNEALQSMAASEEEE